MLSGFPEKHPPTKDKSCGLFFQGRSPVQTYRALCKSDIPVAPLQPSRAGIVVCRGWRCAVLHDAVGAHGISILGAHGNLRKIVPRTAAVTAAIAAAVAATVAAAIAAAVAATVAAAVAETAAAAAVARAAEV